jgi:hypothetical protein
MTCESYVLWMIIYNLLEHLPRYSVEALLVTINTISLEMNYW